MLYYSVVEYLRTTRRVQEFNFLSLCSTSREDITFCAPRSIRGRRMTGDGKEDDEEEHGAARHHESNKKTKKNKGVG